MSVWRDPFPSAPSFAAVCCSAKQTVPEAAPASANCVNKYWWKAGNHEFPRLALNAAPDRSRLSRTIQRRVFYWFFQTVAFAIDRRILDPQLRQAFQAFPNGWPADVQRLRQIIAGMKISIR